MRKYQKDYNIPDNNCPYCGHYVDQAMQENNLCAPGPGDICICIRCSEVAVFDDTLRLRKPTQAEAKEIAADPYIKSQQKIIITVNAMIKIKNN